MTLLVLGFGYRLSDCSNDPPQRQEYLGTIPSCCPLIIVLCLNPSTSQTVQAILYLELDLR